LLKYSLAEIAREYASSPVAHPADQIRTTVIQALPAEDLCKTPVTSSAANALFYPERNLSLVIRRSESKRPTLIGGNGAEY